MHHLVSFAQCSGIVKQSCKYIMLGIIVTIMVINIVIILTNLQPIQILTIVVRISVLLLCKPVDGDKP